MLGATIAFIIGVLLGFGLGFFVYHNNSTKASKVADKLKDKADEFQRL